jgi:hypothetical protein
MEKPPERESNVIRFVPKADRTDTRRGELVVVEIESRYTVVDGQHRLAAMRMLIDSMK